VALAVTVFSLMMSSRGYRPAARRLGLQHRTELIAGTWFAAQILAAAAAGAITVINAFNRLSACHL